MEINFTKMHGLGNDFVVVDAIDLPVTLTPAQVRLIADRRLGIGCDQLLLLESAAGTGADALFRIFNADGGEVNQCGNGARCVAAFLRDRGRVSGPDVRLATGAGVMQAHIGTEGMVTVNMGVPVFEPALIPLNHRHRQPWYSISLDGRPMEFAALSLGNPHAVIVVEDLDSAPVDELGPVLQASGVFPDSVNVGFMQIRDSGHVGLRVFERGAGETPACGSGACAAVAAGRLNNGLDKEVEVKLKGGTLRINWAGEGEPIWMTGPVVTVYEGRIKV